MTRLTSIEAYHDILETGWIGEQHKKIYKVMFEDGPLTSGECFWIMNQGKVVKALSQSRARFTEMRDMGILCEVGRRKCSVTERTVILWDVTDKYPVKPTPKLTNEQKIKRLKKACAMLMHYSSDELKDRAKRILRGEE